LSEDPRFPLTKLLAALKARNYHFITPTPATHARAIARRQAADDLRDVFGWSLPFDYTDFDLEIFAALQKANAVDPQGAWLKSRVRVSSLDDDFFLHSAYPTTQQDAVFFGPDSYRFAAFLKAELPGLGARKCIVDIGSGSGVGAIVAAKIIKPESVWLVDINGRALELAMANAAFADIESALIFSQTSGVPAEASPDLIIANPPYIADPLHRAYRDGGAMRGAALSLDWARQAAEKLAPGGAFLLYTGSAIVNGQDRFKAALLETLRDFDVSYRELDPDVFGEELEREDYADVERIAVVGVAAVKR